MLVATVALELRAYGEGSSFRARWRWCSRAIQTTYCTYSSTCHTVWASDPRRHAERQRLNGPTLMIGIGHGDNRVTVTGLIVAVLKYSSHNLQE